MSRVYQKIRQMKFKKRFDELVELVPDIIKDYWEVFVYPFNPSSIEREFYTEEPKNYLAKTKLTYQFEIGKATRPITRKFLASVRKKKYGPKYEDATTAIRTNIKEAVIEAVKEFDTDNFENLEELVTILDNNLRRDGLIPGITASFQELLRQYRKDKPNRLISSCYVICELPEDSAVFTDIREGVNNLCKTMSEFIIVKRYKEMIESYTEFLEGEDKEKLENSDITCKIEILQKDFEKLESELVQCLESLVDPLRI